jgi:site-specific DNA-methyltransferase (adenine-specific)
MAEKFEGAYGGCQLKPAVEVIIKVQKPLSENTFAEQALANGKGCLWLDDCRIPYADETDAEQVDANFTGDKHEVGINWSKTKRLGNTFSNRGRFPANLLVSDNVLDNGESKTKGYSRYFSLDAWAERNLPFLPVPKASKKEKDAGLENVEAVVTNDGRKKPIDNPYQRGKTKRLNSHPTVKPIKLMAYLITMGSREGDVVLDPFCGSGPTCLAAHHLKRRSIGIEIDANYFEVANARYRSALIETYRGSDKE